MSLRSFHATAAALGFAVFVGGVAAQNEVEIVTIDPEDFLVESFCPDDAYNIDPRDCKSPLQKVGTDSFYVRLDRGNYQATHSYKASWMHPKAPVGSDTFVGTMDFRQAEHDNSFAVDEFNSHTPGLAHRDGWNLHQIDAQARTSIYGTMDPGTHADTYTNFVGTAPSDNEPDSCGGGGQCDQRTPWLLHTREFTFDSASATVSADNAHYSCQGKYDEGCSTYVSTRSRMARVLDNGVGGWERFPQTIIVDHLAYDHPLGDGGAAMERFYFTKEFGFTMWEAFTNENLGRNNSHRCVGTESITYSHLGGYTLYRQDCRQWTETYKLSADRIASHLPYPLVSYRIQHTEQKGNLILNGDAGDDMDHWNGFGDSAAVTVAAARAPEELRLLKSAHSSPADFANQNRVFVFPAGANGASLLAPAALESSIGVVQPGPASFRLSVDFFNAGTSPLTGTSPVFNVHLVMWCHTEKLHTFRYQHRVAEAPQTWNRLEKEASLGGGHGCSFALRPSVYISPRGEIEAPVYVDNIAAWAL